MPFTSVRVPGACERLETVLLFVGWRIAVDLLYWRGHRASVLVAARAAARPR